MMVTQKRFALLLQRLLPSHQFRFLGSELISVNYGIKEGVEQLLELNVDLLDFRPFLACDKGRSWSGRQRARNLRVIEKDSKKRSTRLMLGNASIRRISLQAAFLLSPLRVSRNCTESV